jgi:hypothetical protein
MIDFYGVFNVFYDFILNIVVILLLKRNNKIIYHVYFVNCIFKKYRNIH